MRRFSCCLLVHSHTVVDVNEVTHTIAQQPTGEYWERIEKGFVPIWVKCKARYLDCGMVIDRMICLSIHFNLILDRVVGGDVRWRKLYSLKIAVWGVVQSG